MKTLKTFTVITLALLFACTLYAEGAKKPRIVILATGGNANYGWLASETLL